MDDQLKQITERKTSPEDSSLILALAMLELTKKVSEHNDTLKTFDDRLSSLQEATRYLPLVVKMVFSVASLILLTVIGVIIGLVLKG